MQRTRKAMRVYPGGFVWKWLPDRAVVSLTSAILFGLASSIIVVVTVITAEVNRRDDVFLHKDAILALAGALAALSVVFLWGGMWTYWVDWDTSPTATKRLWFVIMVCGVWYGAIAYFLAVYVRTRKSNANRTAVRK